MFKDNYAIKQIIVNQKDEDWNKYKFYCVLGPLAILAAASFLLSLLLEIDLDKLLIPQKTKPKIKPKNPIVIKTLITEGMNMGATFSAPIELDSYTFLNFGFDIETKY